MIVISLATFAPANTKADAYMDEGDKYFKAGDYTKAVEAYQKVVALDPSMGLAYYGIALSYHQQKQWQLAIPSWKRARVLLQPEAAMLLIIGNDYFYLEQYDDALKAFQDAVQLQPEPLDLAMANYWIGATYNQIRQSAKAIAPLQEAMRLKPDDPDFNFELGSAYYQLKQYQRAIPILKEAIRLRPGFAMAYYNLGVVCLGMHEKDEALEVYDKLQAVDAAKAQQLHSKIADEMHQDTVKARGAQ